MSEKTAEVKKMIKCPICGAEEDEGWNNRLESHINYEHESMDKAKTIVKLLKDRESSPENDEKSSICHGCEADGYCQIQDDKNSYKYKCPINEKWNEAQRRLESLINHLNALADLVADDYPCANTSCPNKICPREKDWSCCLGYNVWLAEKRATEGRAEP